MNTAGIEEGWRNLDPARDRVSTDVTIEECMGGVIRMHVIADVVCAVIWLSGKPWCAIATGPNGLIMAYSNKEEK